jgi:hypothetical protein
MLKGIEDYLEIMHLAGISELRKPVHSGGLPSPARVRETLTEQG